MCSWHTWRDGQKPELQCVQGSFAGGHLKSPGCVVVLNPSLQINSVVAVESSEINTLLLCPHFPILPKIDNKMILKHDGDVLSLQRTLCVIALGLAGVEATVLLLHVSHADSALDLPVGRGVPGPLHHVLIPHPHSVILCPLGGAPLQTDSFPEQTSLDSLESTL